MHGVSDYWLLGSRASRPHRAAGAKVLSLRGFMFSRFALIAGGTPAIPVSTMDASWMEDTQQLPRTEVVARLRIFS
jgi:hypothetical protein